MAQKDIFKIDNYFIKIGIFLLVLSTISIFADPRTYYDLTLLEGSKFSFANWEGRTLEEIKEAESGKEILVNAFPLIRSLLLLNGIIILSIGIYYRKKENKIISIWDALERAGEAKVSTLSLSLGIPRTFIIQHLKDINAQRNVYYVLDVDHDKIVDGKLMAEYSVSGTCTGCGKVISGKVSLHASVLPKCSYCGTPLSTEDLNKLKQDVLTNRHEQLLTTVTAGSDFSIPAFIALLIFFWPGAIIYLIVKKGKVINSYSDQFKNLQQQFQAQGQRTFMK